MTGRVGCIVALIARCRHYRASISRSEFLRPATLRASQGSVQWLSVRARAHDLPDVLVIEGDRDRSRPIEAGDSFVPRWNCRCRSSPILDEFRSEHNFIRTKRESDLNFGLAGGTIQYVLRSSILIDFELGLVYTAISFSLHDASIAL
jgi:hypothetical protein